MNESVSNLKDFLSGITLEPLVGLLLFVVSINALPDVVTHRLKLHAEYLNIFSIINKRVKVVKEDLDSISNWMDDLENVVKYEEM